MLLFIKTRYKLYPFVTYIKEQGKLTHFSAAIISDCLEHSTNVFHAFIKKYIEESLKKKAPMIEKLYFFTDGCAAQYKSFKMTLNIAAFKKDFNLEVELNYFASGHRKNACDGVGGTLKRMAEESSLREKLIETPLAFFELCDQKVEKIQAVWINTEEIKQHIETFKLEERYLLGGTIQGSRQFHKIIPWTTKIEVDMFEISEDQEPTFKKIFESEDISQDVVINLFSVNSWYACIYDSNWYMV
jgi:hypothetical protein